MKLRHGNAKWVLAAIPLLAMFGGVATLAASGLSANHCERYPYTVVCARNYTPGGPIGCFDTLCDAVAAGAHQCKRATSACEP